MSSFKQISFIFKISAFFILFSMSFSGLTVYAADVILTWDRPNDSRVSGYKIFYGLTNTDFKSTPKETINTPDQTSYDIYDLEAGNTYGFAAKSIDKKGNESDFSEVLYYDVSETKSENSSGGGGGGGCFLRIISDLSIPKHK